MTEEYITKVLGIPGVKGVNTSTVCWTFMVETDGREPEDILGDIKRIIPLEEYKILHGKN